MGTPRESDSPGGGGGAGEVKGGWADTSGGSFRGQDTRSFRGQDTQLRNFCTLTTNQYAKFPSATPTYDANGHLTSDGFHTYEWNADGNLGVIDSGKSTAVTSAYDALGRRVERVPASGANTQNVWDPLGWRRATMSGQQTFTRGFIQLPGQSLAFYNGSGFNAIRHADWLGSTRLATAPNGTYLGSVAVSPNGYEYAPGGSSAMNFTNQRVLIANDLWDFPARELHSTQGALAHTGPSRTRRSGYHRPADLEPVCLCAKHADEFGGPLRLGALLCRRLPVQPRLLLRRQPV